MLRRANKSTHLHLLTQLQEQVHVLLKNEVRGGSEAEALQGEIFHNLLYGSTKFLVFFSPSRK